MTLVASNAPPTNVTRCLLCQKPYVLNNNICITKCPDGTKLDSQGIVCNPINTGGGGGNTGGNTGGGNGTNGGNNGGGGNVIIIKDGDSKDDYIDNTTQTQAYFTTQIAQVVLGGVAVGARFKDPSSLLNTNLIGLWAPLELLSFGA